MSADQLSLWLQIKSKISEAMSGLKQVKGEVKSLGKETGDTSKKMGAFEQAGAQAAGMLMRDMVQGATAAFGEISMLGGKVVTLQNSFNAMTAEVGATTLTLESLRDATGGTVADVDLLTAANQALALGLPTEKMSKLMGAAIKLGHAMGIDAGYAVDSVTKGIGRQSKMILDNLGVVFESEEAYRWYAETIGVASNQLDENQRKLAWQEYAMEQVISKSEVLGDITSDTTIAQEKFAASMTNLKTRIGGALAPLGAMLPILQSTMPLMSSIGMTILPGMIKSYGGLIPMMRSFASIQTLVAIKTKLVAAAQGLLNMVMNANPIFLVVTAIAALVAALIYLYHNFEPVKIALDNVGNALRVVFGGAITFVKGLIEGFIGALKSVWDFLSGIGGAIVDFFTGTKTEAKSASNEMATAWGAGLNRMSEETDDFYRDMYGGSLWPNLMKGMVRETVEGVGAIKDEFGSLSDMISPSVTVAGGEPQMPVLGAPGGLGGGMSLSISVPLSIGSISSDTDKQELVDMVKAGITEALIAAGVMG